MSETGQRHAGLQYYTSRFATVSLHPLLGVLRLVDGTSIACHAESADRRPRGDNHRGLCGSRHRRHRASPSRLGGDARRDARRDRSSGAGRPHRPWLADLHHECDDVRSLRLCSAPRSPPGNVSCIATNSSPTRRSGDPAGAQRSTSARVVGSPSSNTGVAASRSYWVGSFAM
jgi:hypothetical protein